MSPSTLRRYRAERLLRQEFGGLREEVLGSVRGRLRARGVHLDGGDLEACYAQAWQGLYAAVAAGEQIANPGGWLTVVTFRRAIDEHRGASGRAAARAAVAPDLPADEPDLSAELDDRARLRHLFEALRSRLSARECEAASLCYLQGLTRAQAAERMGLSEARMVKLMEGGGPGRPGVAGKVGELLEAIRAGEWCEQQASLMRGFAFGILDPDGERYRLARLHQRECPACRAYVLSLRGLAAVLPPLPLPWALGLGASPIHAPPTPGVGASAGVGAGTVSASGAAAGVGGAGGGWLLAGGSAGAKLAVSCLIALSVGCVALTVTPHRSASPHRRPSRHTLAAASIALADVPDASGSTALGGSPGPGRAISGSPSSSVTRAATLRRAAARRAQREFGPEQAAEGSTPAGSPAQPTPVTARAASVQRPRPAESPVAPTSSAPTSTRSGPPTHAEREFGPE